ncbi:MAG: hypothetical protein H7346_23435 [Burkholderiaceae bacterium]|nr:hypothetical protein [Burkholderiaceae bacterium]
MSDNVHCVIAAVALPAPGDAAAPMLPKLQSLLAQLDAGPRLVLGEGSPAMPWEMRMAHLSGLPGAPGHVPWAAHESGTIGTPCAWLTLCHWNVGTDHVLLASPGELAVDEVTAAAVHASMVPYFLEDGITLEPHPARPGVWLATGELFRHLSCMSLDRVIGRRLTRNFFEARDDASKTIRRLQNEMQMLLYTHPANDRRAELGLPPVNSFWVTGAGVLDEAIAQPHVTVLLEQRLQEPALRQDAAAHAQAWRDIDASTCADLLARLKAGQHIQLSLCGELAAQDYSAQPRGAWARATQLFKRRPDLRFMDSL